jgi:hypothetical protein
MNVVPRFSFNYNGKPFDISDAVVTKTEYGYLYSFRDGLRTELRIKEYPGYNAAGWVLWFENESENESGLISDIRDCVASSYPLTGLDPDGVYTVTDIDTNETRQIPGKTLITEGLSVNIPNRRESKVLLYKLKK